MPELENLVFGQSYDYMAKGYVPMESQYDNSVSHALEYYVADYALSTLAEELGKKEDAKLFRKRSTGFINAQEANELQERQQQEKHLPREVLNPEKVQFPSLLP